MIPAVFLDRDGTINSTLRKYSYIHADMIDDCPYNADEVKILPGVIEGISKIRDKGMKIVVVTNQPAISQGKYPICKLIEVNKEICRQTGLSLEDFFVCPHDGRKTLCECRKPAPGMAYEAALKFKLDLASSYVVGDSWRDIGFAKEAGISKSVFLVRPPKVGYQNGNIADMCLMNERGLTPSYTAEDFTKALDFILNRVNV